MRNKSANTYSLSRPKPYYNFPASEKPEKINNSSRISDLSISHNINKDCKTIDVTNQLHKYRDLLDGANDQSMMKFMNTLRQHDSRKKRLSSNPKTFRASQRKSICQIQSKRVSDLSPQARVTQFYQYWNTRKGSEVRDFVNFGCQLRTYKQQSQIDRKPFNYMRTIIQYPSPYDKVKDSVHCPKLIKTIVPKRRSISRQQ